MRARAGARAEGSFALGVLLITTANLLGGLSYLFQKLALGGLPAATISCLRNAIAIVPMAVWVLARGPRPRAYTRRDLRRIVLLGVCAYGLPLHLGVVGLARSTASNASILVLLEPAVVLLFAWWLLRERITAANLLGVAIGLAGALTIVLEGATPADLAAGEHFAGNLLLALHGILWGLYTPLVKPLAARHDPLELALLTLIASELLLAPAALLERGAWGSGADLARALTWTAVLGLASTFLGTWAWVSSIRHLPAATVAPFVFLQPVVGIAAGTVALGEAMTAQGLVGAALIAAGVLLTLRARPA